MLHAIRVQDKKQSCLQASRDLHRLGADMEQIQLYGGKAETARAWLRRLFCFVQRLLFCIVRSASHARPGGLLALSLAMAMAMARDLRKSCC